jgi:hypothetical protein
MSGAALELEDYVQLFQRYGQDLGSLFREPDDDRYAFLVEQVIRLLTKPSAFNLSLPEAFRIAAHRFHRGRSTPLAQLNIPANQHFMPCDPQDLVMPKGGLALERASSAHVEP